MGTNITISLSLGPKRQTKKWIAPNGYYFDIYAIWGVVINTQGNPFTLIKRIKEAEHPQTLAHDVEDNDVIYQINASQRDGAYPRICPKPISVKYMQMLCDTTVTGFVRFLLNGELRKMTPKEQAYEVASKNA